MNEKLIGYLLLVTGLFVMFYSAYNIYSVFTARADPVDLFKFSGINVDLSNLIGQDLSPQERLLLEDKVGDLDTQLVEPGLINQPLNLFAHLLLMSFILNVGFKSASLGVQFLRPIKVKLNTGKDGVSDRQQ